MRCFRPHFALTCLLLCLAAAGHAQEGKGKTVDNNGKPLSGTEQKAFLSTRLPSGQIGGTFDALASVLYAVNGVAIHTENASVAAVKLTSPFPDDYRPTWSEYFDALAVQTRSTWAYDAKRNYWVFSFPRLLKSYALDMAESWTVQERGSYTAYKPAAYPVGMDIYELGTYSATEKTDEAKLFEKVRDTLAMRFASLFDREITVRKMTTESVDGAVALFFEVPSPVRKELVWRQWVFVKNGKAFAIVSTLKKDEPKLLEEVKQMVKSFRVR